MTDQDQSRAEFEHNQRVAATQAVSKELNRLGVYMAWPTVTNLVDLVRAEFRDSEILPASAPIVEKFRNSENRATEESSGAELPEPAASIPRVASKQNSLNNSIDVSLPIGTKLYTEQQVRALLTSANEARREAQRQAEVCKAELAKLERYRFMMNRGALVPPGYKAVPSEPTEDMFIDGMEASCVARPSIDDDSYVRSIWNAMLAAAHRGGRTALDQQETRVDAGSDRGAGALPEIIEKALDWIENDTRECVRDLNTRISDPNEIYASLDQLERILRAAPSLPQWLPIESAPRDGAYFYALIDGLPYCAFFDEYGRFIRVTHSNIAKGPTYQLHRIEGKELREMLSEAEPAFYVKVHMIWQAGFDHQPTDWMPLPQPPKEQTDAQ